MFRLGRSNPVCAARPAQRVSGVSDPSAARGRSPAPGRDRPRPRRRRRPVHPAGRATGRPRRSGRQLIVGGRQQVGHGRRANIGGQPIRRRVRLKAEIHRPGHSQGKGSGSGFARWADAVARFPGSTSPARRPVRVDACAPMPFSRTRWLPVLGEHPYHGPRDRRCRHDLQTEPARSSSPWSSSAVTSTRAIRMSQASSGRNIFGRLVSQNARYVGTAFDRENHAR
jgi:hypothetical protein